MRPAIGQIISTAIAATVLMTVATGATAQAKKEGASKRLAWGPALDGFPKGAKMAIQKGDPTKSGEFVIRLLLPAGYKIPPHWHPTDEHVRIVSGQLLVGMGDTLDASKTKKLAPGDTGTIPAKMHHFAIMPVATELTVRAEGPFAITYVNPADDPRKKH
jgi:mannose-6-phosphate isomerase-like protein (cupin superfamily)